MGTSIDLITVATFETALEAWIYRNKLATNEIDAFVTDEHVANADWMYSGAIGGVKVQIPNHEIEKFKIFVEHDATRQLDWFSEPAETGDNLDSCRTCPKCNSIETSLQRWPKRINFLIWLVLGLVVPIYWPKLNCNRCGYSDREPIGVPRQLNIIHLLLLMTLVAIATALIQQRPVTFNCLTPWCLSCNRVKDRISVSRKTRTKSRRHKDRKSGDPTVVLVSSCPRVLVSSCLRATIVCLSNNEPGRCIVKPETPEISPVSERPHEKEGESCFETDTSGERNQPRSDHPARWSEEVAARRAKAIARRNPRG